jgi:hypothetical protein
MRKQMHRRELKRNMHRRRSCIHGMDKISSAEVAHELGRTLSVK